MLDLIVIIAFGIAVIVACGFAFTWLSNFSGRWRVRDRTEEREFETFLRENHDPNFIPPEARRHSGGVLIPEASAQPALSTAPPAAPPWQPPPPPSQAPVPFGSFASVAEGGPADVAQRLIRLGLLRDFEGRLSLDGEPDGLIYRMKSGRVAVILPRLEAAAVLAQQARRFDVLFVALDNGGLLVVEDFQKRMGSLMNEGSPSFPGVR
jgi:hypothetical protein